MSAHTPGCQYIRCSLCDRALAMQAWISLTVRTLDDRLEVLEDAANATLHGADAAYEVLRAQRDAGRTLLKDLTSDHK